MTERITHKSIAFTRPFALSDIEGEQPAGVYDVEMVDEQLDGLSFVAYRRISTTITLNADSRANRARQMIDIDPEDLAVAIARDAAAASGHA